METQPTESRQDRTPYEPPAVVFESKLEVRAGSPVRIPNPLGDLPDPAGLWKK